MILCLSNLHTYNHRRKAAASSEQQRTKTKSHSQSHPIASHPYVTLRGIEGLYIRGISSTCTIALHSHSHSPTHQYQYQLTPATPPQPQPHTQQITYSTVHILPVHQHGAAREKGQDGLSVLSSRSAFQDSAAARSDSDHGRSHDGSTLSLMVTVICMSVWCTVLYCPVLYCPVLKLL
jgi:hypothetical protein